MHTLAFVVTIDKTVALFTRCIAENAANAAKEEDKNQSPHATSDARTLPIYFRWSLIPTTTTYVLKWFPMGSDS